MSELHSTMMRCGYTYIPSQKLKDQEHLLQYSDGKGVYAKDYPTSEGNFKIALIFQYDPYTNLPLAYILDKPAHLNDVLLPHINHGWYLCYVRESEADWNPNDLHAIYAAVDHQIQKTLDNSVHSIHNRSTEKVELEGEFSVYWKAEKRVFALSDFNDLNNKISHVTTNKNDDSKEYVLYHQATKREYKKWSDQRNLQEHETQTFHTHVIKVRPNKLAGVNWPPKNSHQLFKWLGDVDHNAKVQLAKCFVPHVSKNHLILFEIENQDTLGLVLELNLQATQLKTYANSSITGKHSARKIQYSTIISVLSGKYAFNKFQRIAFTKADERTILTRNRSRPEIGDLSSKCIALIGCGTIGGYAAELLLRSGAGTNNGKFDLYDFDTYSPQNFGRHTLNTSDFGNNKAKALTDRLTASTHLQTNIHGFACDFILDSRLLPLYDIIIDATGRPPIAKRLSYLIRNIDKVKKPILIHGFNDANGRVSKVFIDDSMACINCMISDPAFYKDGIDKRFLYVAELNEKKISCGSTYTPYDAAVSITTAALIQEAALSTLEPSQSWNYKEHVFERYRSSKPKLIESKAYCDICNASK